jgi:O-antigen/teichoic acid export membrane protein
MFDALFAVSTQVLTVRDRRSLITPISGLAVAVNVVLNLILIPRMSFTGAALAMTASEATLAVFMVAFAVRLAGKVSWWRVLVAAAAGGGAMSATAVALGDGALGIAASLLVYAAIVLGLERRLFPTDFRLFLASIDPRHPATPGVSGSGA